MVVYMVARKWGGIQMVEITRRRACLTGGTVAGLEISSPWIGVEIMPVYVGLWLARDADTGRLRWRVDGDSEDCAAVIRFLQEREDMPDGLDGYCIVAIGQVMAADDGGWYVYGYCVGGRLSPRYAIEAAHVHGEPVMPYVHQMRIAVADYLAGRYRDQMEAVAPHKQPRTTTDSDAGYRDGLPVATDDPHL